MVKIWRAISPFLSPGHNYSLLQHCQYGIKPNGHFMQCNKRSHSEHHMCIIAIESKSPAWFNWNLECGVLTVEVSPQQKSSGFKQAARSYVYAKIAFLFFLSIYWWVWRAGFLPHDTLPCVLMPLLPDNCTARSTENWSVDDLINFEEPSSGIEELFLVSYSAKTNYVQ